MNEFDDNENDCYTNDYDFSDDYYNFFNEYCGKFSGSFFPYEFYKYRQLNDNDNENCYLVLIIIYHSNYFSITEYIHRIKKDLTIDINEIKKNNFLIIKEIIKKQNINKRELYKIFNIAQKNLHIIKFILKYVPENQTSINKIANSNIVKYFQYLFFHMYESVYIDSRYTEEKIKNIQTFNTFNCHLFYKLLNQRTVENDCSISENQTTIIYNFSENIIDIIMYLTAHFNSNNMSIKLKNDYKYIINTLLYDIEKKFDKYNDQLQNKEQACLLINDIEVFDKDI